MQVPPPPPAACQAGIILDYPAVSSHPRGEARAGGGYSRGRESHFRGRGLRAPEGRDGQVWAAPPPPVAAQTGRGRGGRGCVTLEMENARGRPQQAPPSEPGVGPGPPGEAVGQEES